MNCIIRGTTPTLKYNFGVVNPANISVAYLTIKDKTHTLEKDLSEATVEQKSLSWKLSQEETLAFGSQIETMLNWKTADGTRGASKNDFICIDRNLKEVVI